MNLVDGSSAPRTEYVVRLEARCKEQARQARLYRIFAKARMSVVYLVVILGWLGEKERRTTQLALLGLPTVLILTLMIARNRAARRYRRVTRALQYYEDRLACLDERWAGRGEPGTRFLDDTHPYARDLDLFGTGCLFERLCTARTAMGQATLAAWLLSAAAPDVVRKRQAAVMELRLRLDCREDLAILGSELPHAIDPEAFASWCTTCPGMLWPGAGLVSLALMALAALALLGCIFGSGPLPLLLILLLQLGLTVGLRHRTESVLGPAQRATHLLAPLAALLARLEQESVPAAPHLHALLQALQATGQRPSRRVLRLSRLNVLQPLASVLLCRPQLALAVSAWRHSSGRAVAQCLGVVGEFEALSALATYTYENPADPFPDLVAGGPCLNARALGHPLLPRSRCVANDVTLSPELRVLIVSGSNMSGKSTFLRTIGTNAVLAWAGAPVRADQLQISLLAIGATLRIQDSLQAGQSRFYAELLRLRQLIDLAKGPAPLLFLLDEILHGTNSQDRRTGAQAVIRLLIGLGAVGLVTTHDLALTDLVAIFSPVAANVHFRDDVENGSIKFDYRLRQGVVQQSNALALMRAIGIDV